MRSTESRSRIAVVAVGSIASSRRSRRNAPLSDWWSATQIDRSRSPSATIGGASDTSTLPPEMTSPSTSSTAPDTRRSRPMLRPRSSYTITVLSRPATHALTDKYLWKRHVFGVDCVPLSKRLAPASPHIWYLLIKSNFYNALKLKVGRYA